MKIKNILLILFTLFVITSCGQKQSGEYYFKKKFIDPMPASITEFKTLDCFKPTLGDGILTVSFGISSEDLDKLLHGMSKSESSCDQSLKEFYQEVFGHQDDDKLEFYYSGTLGIDHKRIITNKEHTKAIFNLNI